MPSNKARMCHCLPQLRRSTESHDGRGRDVIHGADHRRDDGVIAALEDQVDVMEVRCDNEVWR